MTLGYALKSRDQNFTLHRQNIRQVKLRDQIEDELKQTCMPERKNIIAQQFEPIITLTTSQSFLCKELKVENFYDERYLLISERSKILDTWFLSFKPSLRERLKRLNEEIDRVDLEIDKFHYIPMDDQKKTNDFISDIQNRIRNCSNELN